MAWQALAEVARIAANRWQLRNQRSWEKRFSGEAHQREVQDLIHAGLNPILSATGGAGASSNTSSAPPIAGNLGQTALNLATAKNVKEQARYTGAKADQEEVKAYAYKHGKELLPDDPFGAFEQYVIPFAKSMGGTLKNIMGTGGSTAKEMSRLALPKGPYPWKKKGGKRTGPHSWKPEYIPQNRRKAGRYLDEWRNKK